MPRSPIVNNSDLVTYTLKANGSPIKDTYQVLSIVVENAVNEIPFCKIEIADGSPAEADFPISDSDTFVPGTEIEVQVGYESKNQTIFKGIILKHSIRIDSNDGPVLVVYATDKGVKMTVGRKSAYYRDKQDSEIITELIANNGLAAEVSDTSTTLPEVIQYYTTDWDFIRSRAEANGMIILIQDGKITVKKTDDVTDAVLKLTYGEDILEFDAEIDAKDQFEVVTSSAWDMKNQKVISGSAQLSDVPIGNISNSKLAEVLGLNDYHLQSSGFLDSDSLNTWANAQTTKSRFSKIKGTVKFQGSALAMPATLIDFNGLGDRFNGQGFVSGVRHEIVRGDWITTARIGMSAEWFTEKVKTEAPPAAGLLPGIEGLQIGKVKQIINDPDEEFRILVHLPLIQSGSEGVWARLATFYATPGAGAFFYPEIDDEVVVGFFNEDPRYPVILGAMYSSSRPPAGTPDENNGLKAIMSKTQLKITFNEEQKEITVATPGGNQMILSDEDKNIQLSDQNGNSIKMSVKGIDIISAGSINMKAEQAISVDSSAINCRGNDSINLKAMKISCDAAMAFQANAGASVRVRSSGNLSIDGAMVLINS